MSLDPRLVNLRSAGPPFAVGVIALLGTLPSLTPTTAPSAVPRWGVVAALIVLGVLLAGVAALTGAVLARDVGLEALSPTRLREGEPNTFRAPLVVGGVVALLTLLVHVAAATTTGLGPLATIGATGPVDALDVVARVSGGVFAELVFRFGLMTAVVWLTWIRRPGLDAHVTPLSVWIGIGVAAAASAVSTVPLSVLAGDPLVLVVDAVRTAIGGVAFGWLYWRYDLAAAVVAHAVASVLWALVVAAV